MTDILEDYRQELLGQREEIRTALEEKGRWETESVINIFALYDILEDCILQDIEFSLERLGQKTDCTFPVTYRVTLK